MNDGFLKSMNKKRYRNLLSFALVLALVFSSITNAFAITAVWPGDFLVTEASFNGGNSIMANSSGQFDNITPEYQNVPVDSTFTLTFDRYKVFLFRGSWDPNTGTFSTVLNRELVQIQDSNGNVIPDVSVSNQNDINNNTGSDNTVQIHPNTPLEYNTNYKLVVKKYFAKSNKQDPPYIKAAVPEDVVILFKTTAVSQKPTITKAELRGYNLGLEGLTKGQNLEYNFAVDGQFDNANWKAFDYTDDTANIEVSNMNLTANSKIMVGYAKDDNSAPTDVSDPIAVLYASTSAPSFSGATFDGSNLILNGLPKNASNIEYQIAADGQNYNEWNKLTVVSTTATVDVSGLNLIAGQNVIQVRYKASPPWAASNIAKSFVVVPTVTVNGVSLDKTTAALALEGTKDITLTAAVLPYNAANKNVTWTSSNTSVATVDNTGKVTAVAAGTATITATTEDGSKTAQCEVTVTDKASSNTSGTGSVPSNTNNTTQQNNTTQTAISVTGLSLNKTNTSVQLDKSITLTATVLPDNATNKKVTWRSSNPDVATVDQTGKVTGIKEGKATITAATEDESITKQCEVTVVIDECFIATAAYGSKFQPAVVLLRHFRDDYLLTNTLGSAFVKFYYKNSPPIANFIAHNVVLKNTVKVLLTPFVGVVYGVYHPVLGGTVLLLISLLVLAKRRRLFYGKL